MNRRLFLGSLIAGATLDPERLLWIPGKKLISIPAPAPVSIFAFEEEFRRAVAFYNGDQWEPDVAEARRRMGRPAFVFNRMPMVVDSMCRERNIIPYGREWETVVVEAYRKHRDNQVMVNFMISNYMEELDAVLSPAGTALVSDAFE